MAAAEERHSAYQDGALLHLADGLRVEHAARLVAQRHIDGHLHAEQRVTARADEVLTGMAAVAQDWWTHIACNSSSLQGQIAVQHRVSASDVFGLDQVRHPTTSHLLRKASKLGWCPCIERSTDPRGGALQPASRTLMHMQATPAHLPDAAHVLLANCSRGADSLSERRTQSCRTSAHRLRLEPRGTHCGQRPLCPPPAARTQSKARHQKHAVRSAGLLARTVNTLRAVQRTASCGGKIKVSPCS